MLAELGVSINVLQQALSEGPPLCVQLDGKIIGYCTNRQAKIIANELRRRKFDKTKPVSFHYFV